MNIHKPAWISEFNKTGRDLLSDLGVAFKDIQAPAELHHYTTYEGLRGIIRSGTFRLTDVFNLNDPSELRHGIDVGIQALKSSAKLDVERQLISLVEKNFSHEWEPHIDNFVCCFSRAEDDLGQWRSYADDGKGYDLVFDGASIRGAFSITDRRKIQYNWHIQWRIILLILKKCTDLF